MPPSMPRHDLKAMKAELAKQRKLSAQQYSQKLAPNAAEARSWVSWCFNRGNPGEPPTSLVAWARERGDRWANGAG